MLPQQLEMLPQQLEMLPQQLEMLPQPTRACFRSYCTTAVPLLLYWHPI
jgi:hypothetical protein